MPPRALRSRTKILSLSQNGSSFLLQQAKAARLHAPRSSHEDLPNLCGMQAICVLPVRESLSPVLERIVRRVRALRRSAHAAVLQGVRVLRSDYGVRMFITICLAVISSSVGKWWTSFFSVCTRGFWYHIFRVFRVVNVHIPDGNEDSLLSFKLRSCRLVHEDTSAGSEDNWFQCKSRCRSFIHLDTSRGSEES